MKIKTKNRLKAVIFNVCFCIAAGILFVVFRFFGTFDFENPFMPISSVHLLHSFIEGIVVGILNGISVSLVDLLTDTERFKRRSFRFNILFKSSAYFISIAASIILIFGINDLLMAGTQRSVPVSDETGNQLTRMYVIAVFIYIVCMNSLLSLLKEANKKFGPGIMLKLFSGKYFHPQIEDRIFMFLDLKSSTAIAEKLGHIKYSELVQECFLDIADVALYNKAEIYQYVGDEIVLTWEKEKGTDNNNCLKLFFDFKRVLLQRADDYKEKFGLLPEFKAGVNFGSVTVAEIGNLKKDIAYHGDVLNTASRIQGLCNDYNKVLLISGELFRILLSDKKYSFNEIGSMVLRGKQNPIKVFDVTEA